MKPKNEGSMAPVASTNKLLVLLSYIVTLAIPFSVQYARDTYSPSRSESLTDRNVQHDGCLAPSYTTRIMSSDPLIIHIDNFFAVAEMSHLISLAEPNFQDSRTHTSDTETVQSTQRTSSSAWVPSNDTISDCILKRATAFQGYLPREHMEGLQVTRYLKGQEYINHYDWGHPPEIMSNGRVSTFFGYLDVNCTNCGTRFPRIEFPWPDENIPADVCNFVECADDFLNFKAKAGSAIFWRNLHSNGTGDERTLHAGMPVQNGRKIGLNIWTREDIISRYDE